MTRSSRFHCLIGVINKPTTDDVDGYHLYTDDLLSGVTMGWLLRQVTWAPLVVGGPRQF